jgi:hypothetical protein
MKNIVWFALLTIFADVAPARAAAATLSHDGQTLSLSAENQTFGQVMALFQRHMGLEIDIPGDLIGLRLPLVEVKNLSMREALLKVLEGSNYDYILVAVPGQPDRVRKLVVPARSAKVSATATAFRSTNRPLEDPFGGGVETSFEENSSMQPEPVPAAPAQNPPVQGLVPGAVAQPGMQQPGMQQPGIQQPGVQQGVQPVPANPNQPFGVAPQQGQPQPQVLQPYNPFGNQNNRRSPY